MASRDYLRKAARGSVIAGSQNTTEVNVEPSIPVVAEIMPPNKGAGFWIRAAARIIDTTLQWIVAGITGLLVGLFIGVLVAVEALPASAIDALGTVNLGTYVFGMLANVGYHAISESMHGATLGKLICGLHVLRPDGTKVSFGSALGRSLAVLIDSLLFGLVGYLSMSSSERRQRYGDKWSNTMVIRRADYPTRPWPSAGRFALAFLLALTFYALIVVVSLVAKLV